MPYIAADGSTLLTPEEYITKAQTWLAEDYNLYAGVNIKPVETPPLTQAESIAQARNYNDDRFTPLESIAKANEKALKQASVQAKPNLPTFQELQSTVAENLRLSSMSEATKAKYIERGYNIPPPVSAPNSGYVKGAPSTASLARGIVFGTVKHNNNQKRAHVCGFIDEMRKNQELKKFIKASAQYIREGIREILKMIGLTDTSGIFAAAAARLKEAARWLKTAQKYLKDIINFEKYVLAYITKIKALIQWIMGLPAALIALLGQCLAKFLKLVKSVMVDFFKELTASGEGEGFSDLVGSAKELVDETITTVKLATTAATGAVLIAGAATTGLLIPVSQSELTAANKTIKNYTATLPDGKYTEPTQNKSRP